MLSTYHDTRVHTCLYFICPTGHGYVVILDLNLFLRLPGGLHYVRLIESVTQSLIYKTITYILFFKRMLLLCVFYIFTGADLWWDLDGCMFECRVRRVLVCVLPHSYGKRRIQYFNGHLLFYHVNIYIFYWYF